jgi:Bacteriophage HK97-gp10, putative tail-component
VGAHNELRISGLREFQAALRQLPAALASEAAVIVAAHAQEAARLMDARYAEHEWTGNLRNSLIVTGDSSRVGARWVVKNTAPHAYWAEHGTQLRKTAKGAIKGAMPPLHIFIPIAQRQRRLMHHALIGVIERAGLHVVATEAELLAA